MINRDLILCNAMITGYDKDGLWRMFSNYSNRWNMLPCNWTILPSLPFSLYVAMQAYWMKLSNTWLSKSCLWHYTRTELHSCIVDLIGCAGHLNEAYNYIHEKSLQLSVVIWQSLLAACRVYGNIELGQQAAKCILALEQQDVTTYVQLSNIYAISGRWDNVNKMRRMMKDVGLKKNLGYNWIEVKNKVYICGRR